MHKRRLLKMTKSFLKTSQPGRAGTKFHHKAHKEHKAFPWPAAPRGAAGARAGFVRFVSSWFKNFFFFCTLDL